MAKYEGRAPSVVVVAPGGAPRYGAVGRQLFDYQAGRAPVKEDLEARPERAAKLVALA